ncbi:MAG: hypothetical protein KAS16_09010 [Thermoplasmata archaeon]|nr:hypothetical protein [Thermoplasmata archaeon]
MSEFVNWRILKLQGPDDQSPMSPSQSQVQAPQDQPPYNSPKQGNTKPLIAILIVIVVVIAVIALAFLLIDGESQRSPESTFKKFMELYLFGYDDCRELGDLTTMSFDEDYEEIIDECNEYNENNEEEDYSDYTYTIKSLEFTYRDELSSADGESIDQSIEYLEDYYDITIDDYCFVDYTITITHDGEESPYIGGSNGIEIECVKIDGKWYVIFDD